MLQLHGQNTVQVAYNDRSEVTGYDITKLLDGAKQSGGVLPAAGQPAPKPIFNLAQTYAYDAIGNRTQFLTETGGEKTDVLYESNGLNQYTALKRNEQDPENPTHDPDGNLLDDHRNHYTWNAENRCVKVEGKDGSYTVENAYDYQGRKTTRRHGTATSVKTTIYLYDGWNLLAEIEHEHPKTNQEPGTKNQELISNSVRTYTWGRDLSGSLQSVGGVGGQLAITKKVQNQEDSIMFPCYDANGNIGQMISPKAEILAAYQFDAFGRTVDMAGEKADENGWRFSTKPVDTATGWYYYGYRDYDNETGRWSTRDPIEETGGVNLYCVLENNPINQNDIWGLVVHTGLGFFEVRQSQDGLCIFCDGHFQMRMTDSEFGRLATKRCCGRLVQHSLNGEFPGCCNGQPYSHDGNKCCIGGELTPKTKEFWEGKYPSLEKCIADQVSSTRAFWAGAAGGAIGIAISKNKWAGYGGGLAGAIAGSTSKCKSKVCDSES